MGLKTKPTAVIGISGSIGSGKSTLVAAAVSPPYKWRFLNLLKEYPSIPPIVEKYQERFDPDLLELARKSPPEFAVAFQANMIVASVTLEGLIAEKGGMALLDRTIYEHRHVFAEVQRQRGMLDERSFRAYEGLFQIFTEKVPPPIAYIRLETNVDALKERIRKRGRPQEEWLLRDNELYLQQLEEAYNHFFNDIVKQPVISVNTNDIVVVENNGEGLEEEYWDHAFFQREFPRIVREMKEKKILERVKVV